MKTVQAFRHITTPKDWKDIVHNYENISDSELQERLSKTEEKSKNTRVRKPLRVMLIAAAIVVLSCGSVIAFDGVSGNYNLEVTRVIWGFFMGENADHMQGINQSVTDGGVTVTCKNVIAQDNKLCFQINVKTTDGSKFCEMDNENVTFGVHQTFEKMDLYVDGVLYSNYAEESGRRFLRVDDGSVSDQAEFELTFYGEKHEEGIFLGKEIELKLNGMVCYYSDTTDIGLTSTTLADLFAGVAIESQDQMELYPKTQRGGNVDIQKLPVGNLHIPFSTQYPDCYIDNAGIGVYTSHDPDTGQEINRSALYIAITTGSDEEYNLMKNVVCMNTQSQDVPSLNLSQVQAIDDDRIVIVLMPARDSYFLSDSERNVESIESIKFTNDMFSLYQLVCVKKQNYKTESMYRGQWNFHLKVDESLVSVPKIAENVHVTTEQGKLHIDKLSVKNLSIELTGSFDYDGYEKNRSYEKIVLVHEDGSVTDYAAVPTGTTLYVDGDAKKFQMKFQWCEGKICDTSDIVAVRILGTDIPVGY